ncbi:MAG: response regulator [Candidatus Aminicenantaceae bacterium]
MKDTDIFSESPPEPPVKIFIVEDDAGIAKSLEQSLQENDYEISGIALTGNEAFEKIESAEAPVPDLMIIDMGLNDNVSGIEIAAEVRSRYKIPVVYLTNFSESKVLDSAVKTDAYDYVIKPFDKQKLISTLKLALAKSRIEKKLAESEERFRSQYKGNPVPIYTWRRVKDDFILLDYNYASELITRGKIKAYKGKKLSKIYADNPEIINDIHRCFSEKTTIRREGYVQLKFIKESKYLSITYIFISPDLVMVHTEDITSQKRTEDAMHELSEHLESIREDERREIAREIHDEHGQSLTALKMDISWLKNKLSSKDRYYEPFKKKLNSMIELVDSVIKSTQRISSELRPGVLDDLGLVPALEWQVQQFQERSGIKCNFEYSSEDFELDPACSTALFRIFQESLTNILRHAQATQASFSLKVYGGKSKRLELTVKDNGRGITEQQVNSYRSFGLMGIRERLRPFNGKMKIKGVSRKGTTLTVSIPLNRKQKVPSQR